ncbi:MAG: histidine phosphatase family protein [Aliidongia sp.]
MARLYLVRHGKAAAGWGADADPGLDEIGRNQAEQMAQGLVGLGPLPLIASPLRRTRETAAPLERLWSVTAGIEPRIAEIPAPAERLAERAEWLSTVMQQHWSALDTSLRAWRQALLETLAGYRADSVLVSHFIAINVAVGHALGDERVVCFRPENASCTVIETEGMAFRVIERGAEGASRVL